MKLNKRLFSILLTLVMLLSIVPAGQVAYAAGKYQIGQVHITVPDPIDGQAQKKTPVVIDSVPNNTCYCDAVDWTPQESVFDISKGSYTVTLRVKPNDPDNYEFAGVYEDHDGIWKNLPEVTINGIAADVWMVSLEKNVMTVSVSLPVKEAPSYVVSFDANGGSGTMEDVTVNTSTYTLPTCSFTAPAGKEFLAWNYGYAGDSIILSENITLVAYWRDATYTMSFNPGAGSGTMESVTKTAGSDYTLPDSTFTPPDGKVFDHWLIHGMGYNVGDIFTMNDDYEAFAIYTDKTYTMSFNPGAGSGTMGSVTKTAGSDYTLPDSTFTPPDGKVFDHWLIHGMGYNVGDIFTMDDDYEAFAIYTGIAFTAQPTSGTAKKTDNYAFSWATNTTPDSIYLDMWFPALSDWGANVPLTGLTSSVEYNSAFADGNVSKYRIRAIKGSDTIYSNEFTVTWTEDSSTFAFTTQPTSGTAKKTDNYAFSWATNTTPDSIYLDMWFPALSDWGANVPLTGLTSSVEYNSAFADGNVSKYRIRAIKGSDTIYSNEFTVTWTDESVTTYTVTFDTHGGFAVASQTVNSGETATKPADPTREGYTFDGWYEDNTYNVAFDFTKPITDNVTIHAKWKENSVTPPVPTTYTVKFNANGGSGTMADVTVNAGDKLTLPDCGFIPQEGKEFEKWDAGAPGEQVEVTADCTITAIWKDKTVTPPATTYTVTFDANGHGTAPAAQTVEDGNTATEPTAPTESGWIFGGWYTEAACTNKFDFSTAITGDITLYAKWTEDSVTPPAPTTYTVTFKDGDSTLSTQTVNDGDKATKPADPTKDGYTFDGWHADSTFNAAFDFNTAITADTTVYAKFTKDSTDPVPVTKYTITYNLNGGTLDGKTGTVTVQVEDGTTITLPKPTRDGYTFDYWEGSRYEAGASYKVTGDHTFTAQWKANSTTDKPGDTEKPGNSGKDTSPKTGDETNLALWIMLMTGSLAGLAGVGTLGRKKRKTSK